MRVQDVCFRKSALVALVTLFALAPAANAHPESDESPDEHPLFEAPTMEVVFVLDTTGSMSGLIDGAKRKIWQIADKLKSAKPTPNIRFGLIGYRDRGDSYVTKVHGLNDNMDEVYSNLMQFQADGGGDEPESVNQALHEAVTQMQWDADRETLKTIFLVGDARPHMDYEDDVKYTVSCELAQTKGILINTIQCGDLGQTASFWKEISNKTNGTYAAILQSGGSITVDTPWDPVIAELNGELDATIIPYGTAREQAYAESNSSLLSNMDASAVADRWAYLSKSGRNKAIAGSGDLVELVMDGAVKIQDIEREKLPKELRKLGEEELAALVRQKIERREAVQADIASNVAKRGDFIRGEMAKLSESDKEEVFELSAFQVLEEQAEAAGYTFE